MVVSANVTSESEELSAHVSKAAPEGASINRNFHSAVSTLNDENFGERGVSNDLIGRTIQGLKHRRSAIINQLFDTSAPEVPAYVPPQKVHPALAKLLEYDHVVTNAIKYHVASKQGDASAQHLAAVKRDELFFDLYSTRADLESMFRYMGEDGELAKSVEKTYVRFVQLYFLQFNGTLLTLYVLRRLAVRSDAPKSKKYHNGCEVIITTPFKSFVDKNLRSLGLFVKG
ncbi:hypothetical protein PsorP6_014902 [Peronosclerospora sorghi]|uniref:Uncharacterized protein n=1 Tax=Peronosclerospora sorghi TaxID=230839 RepID=A0ACC0VUF0_9STRA|nr:hypothetical protein PsorP6_014902 [Peronosclerospora sorghi]